MIKVPKLRIKKKDDTNLKGVHRCLENYLLKRKHRLDIIALKATQIELEKRTEKEQTVYLKNKLKELEKEENKIKFEEDKFRDKITDAINQEQMSEKNKLKLEKQRAEIKKKILDIKQVIEKELSK